MFRLLVILFIINLYAQTDIFKQETPFSILNERTRGGKTVLVLLAYLYGFSWCFDQKLLFEKL